MASNNIRIKDIAERAGVSVGTVDRVLHNRPNVSKKALEKVNKALEEMDYQPNMYASALAYNKSYKFFCIIVITAISFNSFCLNIFFVFLVELLSLM